MADSAFWRELAATFLAVPDNGMLRADGHYIIGSGATWNWQLAGGAGDFIRSAFDTLARRGAAQIASAGAPDLLVAWLEELRKESISFRFSGQANEVQDDGSAGRHYLMGSIVSVCQASATLCKKLEAQAIQAEFEAEQRNNSRNWTPFHQQVAALNELQEIHAKPALRLSEEFVRSALGRIHNMKPEDVPAEIINFELAGLAPFYQHVQLVPSASQHKSPHVSDAQRSDQPEPNPVPAIPPEETTAAQLQGLREECRWTIPDLAEAADLSTRQVARHLSGKFQPLPRNISAYERAFSKYLKRQVVIKKMS